ncbi:uncharacterized protein METZ01_LOCUS437651 [marine metagenome]|uniref:Uncharacterized protein n=1 Tax=marine metagenome TaxID=408172 RepID=A0A382YNA9_9ZZZZ
MGDMKVFFFIETVCCKDEKFDIMIKTLICSENDFYSLRKV